jgi:hypothetical protein
MTALSMPLLAADDFSVNNNTDTYLTIVCNYERTANEIEDTVYNGYVFAQKQLLTDQYKSVDGYVYLYIALKNTEYIILIRCNDKDLRALKLDDETGIETIMHAIEYMFIKRSELTGKDI